MLADAIPDLTLERWSPGVVRRHARPGTWYVATQLMLHPVPLDPIPRVITEAGLPVAAVMYDVIPYRFPEQYQVEPSARRQAQLRAPLARTCDALLAISQFAAVTAAEELDFPLDRIAMIGAGVEPQFAPSAVRPLPRADRVLPADVDSYVVAVTGGDERKNTEGLLRGWGRLDAGAALVAPPRDRHGALAGGVAALGGLGSRGGGQRPGRVHRVGRRRRDGVDPPGRPPRGDAVARGGLRAAGGRGRGVRRTGDLLELHVTARGARRARGVLRSPRPRRDRPRDRSGPDRRAHTGRCCSPRASGRRSAGRGRVSPRTSSTALANLGPRWNRPIKDPASRIAIAGPFAGSASGVGEYDERVLEAMRRSADREIVPFVDSSDSSRRPMTPPARRVLRSVAGAVARAVPEAVGVRRGGRCRRRFAASRCVSGRSLDTSPAHLWIHEFGLLAAEFGSLFSAASCCEVAHRRLGAGSGRTAPRPPARVLPILVLPLANVGDVERRQSSDVGGRRLGVGIG